MSHTFNHYHLAESSFCDSEEKLSIFNYKVLKYMNRHAEVEHTKITKSPALWMQDLDIQITKKLIP